MTLSEYDALKIGDAVESHGYGANRCYPTAPDEVTGIVEEKSNEHITLRFPNGDVCGHRFDEVRSGDSVQIFSIKKSSLSMSTLKEKFVLALTKEPQKSFRKAGVTDGDDLLTDEGSKVFLSWLLHNKYADEFKAAVVDAMLKEDEESQK